MLSSSSPLRSRSVFFVKFSRVKSSRPSIRTNGVCSQCKDPYRDGGSQPNSNSIAQPLTY
eukprot:TRINITY_DN8562_c0_g1_i1.p2 TRINITY_DN8562_c0_g1~~TRINITY_DN8562_c0_g1_i1.p2  ORF type:complete len:60 (+),score=3.54 TRINITY_DN8562_c0_g1_i1:235-414(+)